MSSTMRETPTLQPPGAHPASDQSRPPPAYLTCPIMVDGVVITSIADHARFESAGLSDVFPLLPSSAPTSANSSRFSIDGANLENISDSLLAPKPKLHHRRTASASSFLLQRSKFANFGRAAPSRISQSAEAEQLDLQSAFRATPLQLPKLAIPKNDKLLPSSIIPVPTPPIRPPPVESSQTLADATSFHRRDSRPSNQPRQGPPQNGNRSPISWLFNTGVGTDSRREETGSPGYTHWSDSPGTQSPESANEISPFSINSAGNTSRNSRHSLSRRLIDTIFNRGPSSDDGQTPTKPDTETRTSPVSPLAPSPDHAASWLASPTETVAERRECVVCAAEHPAAHFPRPTARCAHDHRTCRACVAAWVASGAGGAGGEGPARVVRCPERGCAQIMTPADVAEAALFERPVHPPPDSSTPSDPPPPYSAEGGPVWRREE